MSLQMPLQILSIARAVVQVQTVQLFHFRVLLRGSERFGTRRTCPRTDRRGTLVRHLRVSLLQVPLLADGLVFATLNGLLIALRTALTAGLAGLVRAR
jgi:hypothetical protein